MKYILIMALSSLFVSCISVRADVTSTETETTVIKSEDSDMAEASIRLVLENQIDSWNSGNLDAFMETYWKSPELKFYGKSGLTKGWQATLERYKKNYPTQAERGVLSFDINDITPIEGNSYWVLGEFHLVRDIGNADGIFMLVFKKINGQWKIVADTSCS